MIPPPIAHLEGLASKKIPSLLQDKRSQTQRTLSVMLAMPSNELAVPSVKQGNTSVSLRTKRSRSKYIRNGKYPPDELFIDCLLSQRSSRQVEAERGESGGKEHETPWAIWSLK